MNHPQKRARMAPIAVPEGFCTVDSAGGPRCPTRMSNWFEFRNVAGDEPVIILIYDEIVDTFEAEFFGMGVSAQGFVEQLQELRGRPLNVHINSPGGLVFGGIAIANALRAHDAPVHTFVDGIAASIASVIAVAGETVTMAPHSMLMIHEAQGITIGPASEHEKQAEILNKLSENIAAVYAERGDKRTNWRAKMAAETWYTDKEAVAAGLADDIGVDSPALTAKFDLSRFKNAPAALLGVADWGAASPTKREVEKALRDAGLSADKAKAFISVGWNVLETRDESEGDGEPLENPSVVVDSGTEFTDPAPETPESAPEIADEDDLAAIYANLQRTCTIHGLAGVGA